MYARAAAQTAEGLSRGEHARKPARKLAWYRERGSRYCVGRTRAAAVEGAEKSEAQAVIVAIDQLTPQGAQVRDGDAQGSGRTIVSFWEGQLTLTAEPGPC